MASSSPGGASSGAAWNACGMARLQTPRPILPAPTGWPRTGPRSASRWGASACAAVTSTRPRCCSARPGCATPPWCRPPPSWPAAWASSAATSPPRTPSWRKRSPDTGGRRRSPWWPPRSSSRRVGPTRRASWPRRCWRHRRMVRATRRARSWPGCTTRRASSGSGQVSRRRRCSRSGAPPPWTRTGAHRPATSARRSRRSGGSTGPGAPTSRPCRSIPTAPRRASTWRGSSTSAAIRAAPWQYSTDPPVSRRPPRWWPCAPSSTSRTATRGTPRRS